MRAAAAAGRVVQTTEVVRAGMRAAMVTAVAMGIVAQAAQRAEAV